VLLLLSPVTISLPMLKASTLSYLLKAGRRRDDGGVQNWELGAADDEFTANAPEAVCAKRSSKLVVHAGSARFIEPLRLTSEGRRLH